MRRRQSQCCAHASAKSVRCRTDTGHDVSVRLPESRYYIVTEGEPLRVSNRAGNEGSLGAGSGTVRHV
jgi:hypothetical protein